MLETGIKGHQEITVTQELTAKNMGFMPLRLWEMAAIQFM